MTPSISFLRCNAIFIVSFFALLSVPCIYSNRKNQNYDKICIYFSDPLALGDEKKALVSTCRTEKYKACEKKLTNFLFNHKDFNKCRLHNRRLKNLQRPKTMTQ